MALVFRFAARSDAGAVRSKNDDSGYAGRYFAVVADGMGGHAGGDVASASTVLDLAHLDARGFAEPDTVLPDEIQTANAFLNKLVKTNPKLAGMGTTITAALITEDRLQFAHIGDSRAYRLKKGRFRQVSTDHTFVQRLVDEGRLDPEAAEYHPHKNVLMRVLGDVDASPELDITSFPLEAGERWLLCSDGLNAVVSDRLIEQKLRSGASLEQIVDDLVDLTLEGGAPDNVTVICLEVVEADEDALAANDTVPLSEEAVAAASSYSHPPHDETMELELVPVVNTQALSGHSPEEGELSPLSAAMVQRKLGVRPHTLVGAAVQATETGVIPVIPRNVDEHPVPLLTGQPLKPVRHTYSEMLGEPQPEQLSPQETPAEAPAETTAPSQESPEEDDEELVEDYELDEEDLEALETTRRRRSWFLPTFVALLALLIAVVTFLGYVWTQTQYYVGEDNGEVAIYTGVSQSLGPITLSEVDEHAGFTIEELAPLHRDRVVGGIPADDRADAERIVENLRGTLRATQPEPEEDAQDDDDTEAQDEETEAPSEPTDSPSPEETETDAEAGEDA
ncbi:PP2C family protein-serine/threonine phosphatase [Nesterenkonia flava]|uniref:Protein phosphatase 2C domain-containing protein n=1 Tax=Nesterenkonia flava TaxID=469799 RepID=A0ABU1FW33_9MICC|nr:protein phosphatase 2C domain-containing protein [Nesterenkonia flava]MDR5712894.1 protein phosphatase 2C domain-containing protein [Nesterenkonia flava]